MDFARIYGPWYSTSLLKSGGTTRSVTTDLEVLTDALDAMLNRWDVDGSARAAGARVDDEYRSARGLVQASELAELGAYDRNTLTLSRRYFPVNHEAWKSIEINCSQARVLVGSGNPDDDQRFIIDYILKNSRARFTWSRIRFLFPLAAVPAIVVGYIGMLFTLPLNGFAHLFAAMLATLAIAGAVMWSRQLHKRYELTDGSFRVRAQSRKETNADRANRHANLKVAAITIPAGAILGIVGTLVTKAISGD